MVSGLRHRGSRGCGCACACACGVLVLRGSFRGSVTVTLTSAKSFALPLPHESCVKHLGNNFGTRIYTLGVYGKSTKLIVPVFIEKECHNTKA